MTIQIGIYAQYPSAHDHSSAFQGGSVPLTSITGHSKVGHDALAIDADKVDGEHVANIVTNARVKAHFPDTIANILSDHSKNVHDIMSILACGVDLPSGVRAYRNALQSIPTEETTKVMFNAEDYDISNNFDMILDSDFYVPSDRYYLIIAQIEFLIGTPATMCFIHIFKNNNQIVGNYRFDEGVVSINIQSVEWLVTSDVIDIRCLQMSGENKNLDFGRATTFLNIIPLGE